MPENGMQVSKMMTYDWLLVIVYFFNSYQWYISNSLVARQIYRLRRF